MADHVSSALYVCTKETDHLSNGCRPIPPDDRSCINNMIRSTLDFEGIMGKISIGPNGKAARPLFINAIYGGKMKYIVKVY